MALGVRHESYAVHVAATRAAAEELRRTAAYDVACLDQVLPDDDGLAVVPGWRTTPPAPAGGISWALSNAPWG